MQYHGSQTPLRLAKRVKKHTITVAYLEGWRCKTATLTPSSTASASVRKYARGTRKLPLTSCSQSLCTFSVHAKNIHGVVGGRSTQTLMLHHSEHHVVSKSYVTHTAQAIVTADVSQTNSQTPFACYKINRPEYLGVKSGYSRSRRAQYTPSVFVIVSVMN